MGFLSAALCACIDLSGAQTSFAVVAASKKHPSSSLTLRETGMNPCAMAVMVISSLPQRSKAKHVDNCTGFVREDMYQGHMASAPVPRRSQMLPAFSLLHFSRPKLSSSHMQ